MALARNVRADRLETGAGDLRAEALLALARNVQADRLEAGAAVSQAAGLARAAVPSRAVEEQAEGDRSVPAALSDQELTLALVQ